VRVLIFYAPSSQIGRTPVQRDYLHKAFHVHTQVYSGIGLTEQAGYFEVPGANLYAVLHPATDPVARVLLVGPFASERHSSYPAWVRWARYLAARRIEVLRYDYRGIGESTGVFEEMSFENWGEDVQILADKLARRSPSVPLVLHGLELGAILAARSFHEGTGDALLLWSPPANANQILRSTLLRWDGLQRQDEGPGAQKTVSQYIRQLEHGDLVEVHGYRWSSRLWRDSFACDLPATMNDERLSSEAYKKPVRIVKLGEDSAPLTKSHFKYTEVNEFSSLYSNNFDWVAEALALPTGGHHEGGD
jgi:Serine aminopeptidase, S33